MSVLAPLHRIALADLFCGLGGTSEGARQAGIRTVIAINHNPHAIENHIANHPDTEHFTKDIHDISPLAAAKGRRIHVVWASSSCPEFSRAKQGKPLDRKIRELSWVLCDWARDLQPTVLLLENVPEIVKWGPLDEDGQPIPEREGETWNAFLERIRKLGYHVEYRLLVAADYGVPTLRKRLHLIARRDGRPIRWPEPTTPKTDGVWPTEVHAWRCLDFNRPVPSIFLTREQAKAWGKANGVAPPNRPLKPKTMARLAAGVRRYVLADPRPFLLCLTHGGRLEPLDEPLRTTTTANGGERALVVPFLANTRNGEREGQAARVRGLREPYGTVTAAGSQGALIAAFLAHHYGGEVGRSARGPLGTVTARDHHSLVTARLGVGSVDEGSRRVAAFMTSYYSGGGIHSDLRSPVPTVVTVARHGLVTVTIGGEDLTLYDIGMRMLTPRELARAQGFPESYLLRGTIAQQIAGIGNSQSPVVARRLFEANLDDRVADEEHGGLFGWAAA